MTDSKKGNTIGEMRKNYLDLANISFANARDSHDYRSALGFMDAFEFTLEPGSEAKREILRKKEQIDQDKNENIRKWNVWKDKLGYWEQYDAQVERDKIEVMAIGERLDHCWETCKRFGLFND